MYPLIYHLGIDDYFPNEDFEPHLFEHRAAWRRDATDHRCSMGRLRTDACRPPRPRSIRGRGRSAGGFPAPRRAGDPVGLDLGRALPEGTFTTLGVADSVAPWPGPPMTMRMPWSRPRTPSVAPAPST